MCRIDSQLKKIDMFEIFNSRNTLYLFIYIQLVFCSFTQFIVYNFIISITYVFRY